MRQIQWSNILEFICLKKNSPTAIPLHNKKRHQFRHTLNYVWEKLILNFVVRLIFFTKKTFYKSYYPLPKNYNYAKDAIDKRRNRLEKETACIWINICIGRCNDEETYEKSK